MKINLQDIFEKKYDFSKNFTSLRELASKTVIFVMVLLVLDLFSLVTLWSLGQSHDKTREIDRLTNEQRLQFINTQILSRTLISEYSKSEQNRYYVGQLRESLAQEKDRLSHSVHQLHAAIENQSCVDCDNAYQVWLDKTYPLLLQFIERIDAIQALEVHTTNLENRLLIDLAAAPGSVITTSLDQLIASIDQQTEEESSALTALHSLIVLLKLILVCVLAYSALMPTFKKLRHSVEEGESINDLNHKLAHFDRLTGLPNRRSLETVAKYLDETIDYQTTPLCFAIIDMEKFRALNEVYGYDFGDSILKRIPDRLSELLTDEQIVFKISQDEFCILSSRGASLNLIERFAKRVDKFIRTPIKTKGHTLSLQSNIGFVRAPDSEVHCFEDLLSAAYEALRYSKLAGNKYYAVYDQMESPYRLTAEKKNQLRKAIYNGEIQPYYQPQIDIKTNTFHGFEVLARWETKEEGVLLPIHFIGHIRRLGLIQAFSESIFDQVLADLKTWKIRGFKDFSISINTDATTLSNEYYCEQMLKKFSQVSSRPQDLVIEITEDTIIRKNSMIERNINLIHERGVGISLDDFGTGYAALQHLDNLPFQEIKIDAAFVKKIGKEKSSEAIIESLLSLAESMGARVVAEGIETPEQKQFLESRRCDVIQGHLYETALSFKDATEYIRSFHPFLEPV